jgi:hypothetical protein
MHRRVEALRGLRRIRETDSAVYHARKFFAERQMNTHLSLRLKVLGILMALLGLALGFRVARLHPYLAFQMHCITTVRLFGSRVANKARQIAAMIVKMFSITSSDVSTYLRHG